MFYRRYAGLVQGGVPDAEFLLDGRRRYTGSSTNVLRPVCNSSSVEVQRRAVLKVLEGRGDRSSVR